MNNCTVSNQDVQALGGTSVVGGASESGQGYPSQFNKGGAKYKSLIQGLDGLVIGFYLRDFRLLDEDWQYFQQSKEDAKAGIFKSSGVLIEFRGKYFTMRPAGKPPYTYVLTSNDMTVKIAKRISNGMFPEVMVEFRSQFLWGGYREAYVLVREWLEKWCSIKEEKVSRADLMVDMQGICEMSFENIVARPRVRREFGDSVLDIGTEVYATGMNITGYRFGSDPIMVRIYNKSLEISKSRKTWFYDLWRAAGWDEETNVWRVEFQLRREILKEFQVETFQSLCEHMFDVWSYLTSEWFTVREESVDVNRSRWLINEFWQIVQDVKTRFGEIVGVVRERIRQIAADYLIPQTIGLISSFGALVQESDIAIDVGDILARLLSKSEEYFRKKGFDMKHLISVKKMKYSLFEGVNY